MGELNVLVTGGSGFVGRWLQATQPRGVFVAALSRAEYEASKWREQAWDVIIHAAPVHPNMVLGVARGNASRVVYVSSGIIYHAKAALESTDWHSEYCFAKMLGEDAVLTYSHGVVVRLFTFCGKWLDQNKALTQFVKAADAGQPLHIYGDGYTVRTYMHGRTMARWLWACALHGRDGEAYDIGSDVPRTMLEVALMVKRSRRSNSEIIIHDQPEVIKHYVPHDTEKTRSLLTKTVIGY